MLRRTLDVVLIGEVRDEDGADRDPGRDDGPPRAHDAAHPQRRRLIAYPRHGRDESLIATSVNCIVAQRLARRLCVHCREAYYPTQAELIADGLNGSSARTSRAKGCTSAPRWATRAASRSTR